MSEKRFKLRNKREVSINYPSTERVYDYEKGDFLYNREIEYLLNSLSEENEQLKSYIDNIFEGNTHICKKINIEDVLFYCERHRDYCYPTCTYVKCFDEENLVEVKEEIRKCTDD